MTIPVFARVALLIASLPATACVKRLPPAATPAPVAPAIASGTPEAGRGRLVVDVVEGPTPIHRVQVGSEPMTDAQGRTSYRLFESPQLMCPASPCVTDVPPGNVLLGFPVIGDPRALETELVHVSAEPTVYRRTLSVYTDNTGGLRKFGLIGTPVGATALVAGIVFLPIGLGKDIDGLTTAGGICMGAGAVVMTLGIWALRRDRPTYRPGAANHFSF